MVKSKCIDQWSEGRTSFSLNVYLLYRMREMAPITGGGGGVAPHPAEAPPAAVELYDAQVLKKAAQEAGNLELAPIDLPEMPTPAVLGEDRGSGTEDGLNRDIDKVSDVLARDLGRETTGPASPSELANKEVSVSAERGAESSIEAPPTSGWGKSWKRLSEGTKRFISQAFEKIKGVGVVQNATDRLRILREDVEQRYLQPRLEKSKAKETQAMNKAAQYDTEASNGEERLRDLEGKMAKLGIEVSSEAVTKVKAEIATQRSLAEAARKAGAQHTEVAAKIKTEFEAHQKRREAAMKSINDRIEAKREANRRELEVLKQKEKGLVAAQEDLKTVAGKLAKTGQEIAEQIPRLEKGAVLDAYEKALRDIGKRVRDNTATHRRIGDQLKDVREQISDLEERNRLLETQKLGQKQKEPVLDAAQTSQVSGEAVDEGKVSVGEKTPQPTAGETASPAPSRVRRRRQGMTAME